jgi:hypothetical protein
MFQEYIAFQEAQYLEHNLSEYDYQLGCIYCTLASIIIIVFSVRKLLKGLVK